jgi:hypothetical protein
MRAALSITVLLFACSERGSGGPPVTNIDAPPSGINCGGFIAMECGPDEFCDFGRNSCGVSDEAGTCRKRPANCPVPIVPELVCGCDGEVYEAGICDANANGVDVDASHRCMVTPGQFACGFRECDVATRYCEVIGSDVGNEPDSFDCKVIPMCPTGDCMCLADEPCGSQCSGDKTKGFTLVCPGG